MKKNYSRTLPTRPARCTFISAPRLMLIRQLRLRDQQTDRRHVCLTTYRSPRGGTYLRHSTKIWQACRATFAATSFFDPIALEPLNEEFVESEWGANNPIYALWTQAQDVWGDQLRGKLSYLVSIGTGVPTLQPLHDDVRGIWETLQGLAIETENTAERFRGDKSILDDKGRYFRFNVDQGLRVIELEESKNMEEIAAATRQYLQSQDVFQQMKACANSLAMGLQDTSQTFVDPSKLFRVG
jgi:hypothetical protein